MDHRSELIKEFQCSGCVGGPDPDSCERYDLEVAEHFRCTNHCPGTRMMGIRSGLLCLGLPKGFCRVSGHKDKSEAHVRIFLKEGYDAHWDNRFNIPVWAMEQDGFLFVRTFMPRVDITVVDVIEGGTLALVPGAVNVGEFIDEID